MTEQVKKPTVSNRVEAVVSEQFKAMAQGTSEWFGGCNTCEK